VVLPLFQVDPECPAASEGVTVTRSILNGLCQELMHRTFITCDDVLRAAGLRAADIDAVFMAGGTTHLPVIRAGVETYFGQRGLLEFEPTEVVARGASLAAPSF
jgi:molecular chaperone DnaK